MKVVQVITSSKGGAGIAALRLHKALQQAGIQSAYLAMDKTLNFDDAEIEDAFFTYQKPSLLKRALLKLQTTINPSYWQQYKKKLAAIDSEMDYEILTLPFSKYRLAAHPLIAEADLVNLHWVGQLLDYEHFFSEVKKPIVWTLHDMNPFMGIFHYKGDQENNAVAKQIDDAVAAIKRQAIQNISKAAIVSPSNWLLTLASNSGVFNRFQLKECIPNGIDLTQFNISKDTTLWDRLGIKDNENVLLFASGSLDNHRKGMDLMLAALEELTIPVTLLTLGKGSVESSNKAVKIIPLGFVSEAAEIAACYKVSDAFVLPSREDNLPNTMLESMATGTPVIGFAIGGMKEHISEGFNGILAEDISAESLAKAIEEFFKNRHDYDQQKIRNYAQENFSLQQQAEAYIEVYHKLLEH